MRNWVQAVCLTLISLPLWASDRPLVFGVHPYLPATQLIEHFTPLIDYLEKELALEMPMRIRIGTSYQDHIDAMASNEVDLAFMGPASYLELTARQAEWPLAAKLSFSGKTQFRGGIVVRQESDIQQLSDLKGKRFAFGDPDSTLSSLVPRRMLQQAGVELADLAKYKHLKNHHNVALGVLLGHFDAGGIKDEVMDEYLPRGLRVVAYTPWVPSHLFVLNRQLPQATQERLRSALHRLHERPDGRAILARIKKDTTALVPAGDADYEPLRQLLQH